MHYLIQEERRLFNTAKSPKSTGTPRPILNGLRYQYNTSTKPIEIFFKCFHEGLKSFVPILKKKVKGVNLNVFNSNSFVIGKVWMPEKEWHSEKLSTISLDKWRHTKLTRYLTLTGCHLWRWWRTHLYIALSFLFILPSKTRYHSKRAYHYKL